MYFTFQKALCHHFQARCLCLIPPLRVVRRVFFDRIFAGSCQKYVLAPLHALLPFGNGTWKPWNETRQLWKETPQPGKETPQPGNETPQPGNETPQLGKETPQPGNETPQLGNETPQPGNETPQLENETPQPGKETPQLWKECRFLKLLDRFKLKNCNYWQI
ncbi:MAG: hypothetical protein PHQ65_17240 [Bacteroidales bacterium]|nr:hypothetical protein [Bacteroidales bacterium]